MKSEDSKKNGPDNSSKKRKSDFDDIPRPILSRQKAYVGTEENDAEANKYNNEMLRQQKAKIAISKEIEELSFDGITVGGNNKATPAPISPKTRSNER